GSVTAKQALSTPAIKGGSMRIFCSCVPKTTTGLRPKMFIWIAEAPLIAAEAVGIGRVAIQRAARYARERVVFGRPIGQNQAIQHPLAQRFVELEAANLMMLKAASLYDQGAECGAEANAAKFLAGEAGFRACETALMTHGGMGYAKEYHVERYLREVLIARIAPVSPQMTLNFIAERVLGLPKSY
ncbi:MAG: acyl-CoA/acyl-ACP dehydrogenase, partial [Hyphomicrobiales bacterium]|nr:acyl-CoA/acyl-ACP dehydrogenase [Hyphomicrobiales bacterium]